MGTKPQGSVVLVSRDGGMFWNVLEYIIMSVVMSRCPPVPMTGRGGNLESTMMSIMCSWHECRIICGNERATRDKFGDVIGEVCRLMQSA